uniref:Uncharacterized protein n=1 Tax=Arundo donax TaxID=35708 RepID=A0A0A9EWG5_ARUDO
MRFRSSNRVLAARCVHVFHAKQIASSKNTEILCLHHPLAIDANA